MEDKKKEKEKKREKDSRKEDRSFIRDKLDGYSFYTNHEGT